MYNGKIILRQTKETNRMCRTIWLQNGKEWEVDVFCTCAECGIKKTKFVKNKGN